MPETKNFDADKLEKLMQADENARVAVMAYQMSEDFGKLLLSMDDNNGYNKIEFDVLMEGSFHTAVKITTAGLGKAAYGAYRMAASPMI
jgi:hypothetical protein